MQRSTISDGQGLSVDVLDYGARIASINFNGLELALSYPNDNDYLSDDFYMGASIGPISNRIRHGKLTIEGQCRQIPCNLMGHSLHSGNLGFDKETWSLCKVTKDSLNYELVYPLNKIGLTGELLVNAIYSVENGSLRLDYHCKTDTATYVNLTNHVYLNIDGGSSIEHHEFELFADNYLDADQDNIPTGELIELQAPFKFQIKNSTTSKLTGLCDHHFNTKGGSAEHSNDLQKMLVARSSKSNIELEFSSNSVGFQFYTGQFLSEPFAPSSGFCVEPQLPPNAINQSSFPSPLLMPNEDRKQSLLFKFNQPNSASTT